MKIPDLTFIQTLIGVIVGLLTIALSVLKIRKMSIKDTETYKAAYCFEHMAVMLNNIKGLHPDNISVTILKTNKKKREPQPIFYKVLFSTDDDIVSNFSDDFNRMEIYLNRKFLEAMLDSDHHSYLQTKLFQDKMSRGWAESNGIKTVDMFLLGIERNFFKRDENGYVLLINRTTETRLTEAEKYNLNTEILDIKKCFKKNLIN